MELDITVTTGEDYAVQREKTMNKQEVYGFLADQGIPYEITEHPPLNNVEELLAAKGPYWRLYTRQYEDETTSSILA